MKTIEQKARAYDEVLNKLRHFIAKGVDPLITRADVQDFFPELKESEDEKVRKEIIRFIRMEVEDEIVGNKWLAWLGKQAERKTPQWMIDFLDSYRRKIGCSLDHDEARDVEGKILCIMQWLEKQGQVKESTISQHENRTCEENGNSLTYENERIRKEIINYFQCQSEEEPTRKEIHDKWIAWLENIPVTIDHEKREGFHLGYKACLEKQGEKKSITFNNAHIIDSALNDYCCKQYDALHKENGGVLSFARLQHLAMDIYGWCNEYLQCEQEPEENKGNICGISPNSAWSEEDEQHVNSLLKRLEGMCKKGATFTATRFAVSQDIDWLKSFQDRVQPQPKQEWSEEDEEILRTILSDGIRGAELDMLQVNWLKSLKPQNRWKPSDEHIKVLNEVLNFAANHESPHWNDYIFGTLNNLIRQLKKLMEE